MQAKQVAEMNFYNIGFVALYQFAGILLLSSTGRVPNAVTDRRPVCSVPTLGRCATFATTGATINEAIG